MITFKKEDKILDCLNNINATISYKDNSIEHFLKIPLIGIIGKKNLFLI